jgi:TatD DNase family protein
LIDTHCHLDSERFNDDRAEVLERAQAAGVSRIIVPGVGPGNWQHLLTWAKSEPRIRVALGVHPQLLPELPESQDAELLEQLDTLLEQNAAVVAVGECGLDGPSISGASVERQVRVLQGHFRMAQKHDLPLIVHCHRLHPALVALLQESTIPEAGLILHSYSGGVDFAKFYTRRGCFFSFAGPVSYPEARKPVASLKAIPLHRLMLETDAPDQAPAPHRGQRSEPAFLPLLVRAAARTLDLPEDELATATTANAELFFRLKPMPIESGE